MLREDNIIDNRKTILRDELLKILPKTESANIAVGYFFISGLSAIIKPLKNVDKVRLLISNSTDELTAEALIEGFHNIEKVITDVERKNFLNDERKIKIITDSKNNTKESLEYMSQTHAERTVVESLMMMMKSKQLEIRVYPKEKLHAKAYIFQSKDKDFAQGMGIVGSSNLSLAGISQNSELNLKTYNSPDVNQLLKWFDELWEDGIEFTKDFNIILEKSWAGRIYSPYELFLKAAYLEYGDKLDDQHKLDPIWDTTFPQLFPFQKIAVDQGRTMFELYGGVIIADVVGLGKTYVGIALLKHFQMQEYRSLIICPPQLIPMWEKACADYEVDVKILSRGKLSQDKYDLFRDYRYKDRDVVLIDESHHFRNNDSRQYENLYQFMQARDAKAILLTATPFSNSPLDIKNQIMLFHQSSKTFIPPANETDLNKYFNQVCKNKANLIDLLQNIMIRRTRRYILKQWGKKDENERKCIRVGDRNMYFPKRKMETISYDVNKVYQRKYKTIVNYLGKDKTTGKYSITFARYSLGLYLKDEYKDAELYKDLGSIGEELVGLIRTLLLKRMESSIEAFKKSITHYINTHKIFLKLLDEKIIPIGDVSYKAMYEIARSDPESIEDDNTIEEFKKKREKSGETKYKFEAFNIDRLIIDVQNDIEIFETIGGLISGINWKHDDKLQTLQKLLDEKYLGKKVIIFSEFATTAKYLNDHINWKGIKEQTDASKGDSISCARRFDPNNNPSNEPSLKKSEETTLLIATDVLSEGINLQAGEVVINYDFHWNPTRLIQRAGRVDRIGSENEFVTVHNFLLDPQMEKDIHLEQQVDQKINNIQKIIGEEYEILKKTEQINMNDIYAIYKGDESILDREDGNPLEPSKFEKILRDIQINNPEFWTDFKKIPDGIRSSDGARMGGKLFLACERGTERSGRIRKYYTISTNGDVEDIPQQKILTMLESQDRSVYSGPSNYDELISIGWKKFIEDTDQIRAQGSSFRLNRAQKWVIEKLMKMGNNKETFDQKDTIETLRKAYSVPILKGKLNRILNQLKKNDMADSELLNHLSRLYIHYNLQKQVKQENDEVESPRILYSKYIGDWN